MSRYRSSFQSARRSICSCDIPGRSSGRIASFCMPNVRRKNSSEIASPSFSAKSNQDRRWAQAVSTRTPSISKITPNFLSQPVMVSQILSCAETPTARQERPILPIGPGRSICRATNCGPNAKPSDKLGGSVKRSLRSLAMADCLCAGPSPRPSALTLPPRSPRRMRETSTVTRIVPGRSCGAGHDLVSVPVPVVRLWRLLAFATKGERHAMGTREPRFGPPRSSQPCQGRMSGR